MELMREKWTDERLDDLNGKVDDLGRRMDLRFDGVDRRFEAMERRFEGFERRFDRMQWLLVTGFLSLGGLIVTLAVAVAA
jgi:hypothetical protein